MSTRDAERRDAQRALEAAGTPKARQEIVMQMFDEQQELRDEVARLRPKPDPRVPSLRERAAECQADEYWSGEVRTAAWKAVGREPSTDERKARAFPPELPAEVAFRRWVGLSDCGQHCGGWDEDALVEGKRKRLDECDATAASFGLKPLTADERKSLLELEPADRLYVAGKSLGVAVHDSDATASGNGPGNTLLHRLAEEMGIKF